MLDPVRTANAEFYRAFEALSIDAMDGVWAHTDDVRCIHPGWRVLVGWEDVRQSWLAIFQGASYMEFNVTDLHVWTDGELACVFCHENIFTFRDGQEVRTMVLATNVFRHHDERWLMVLHHGSPIIAGPESGESDA